MDRDTAGYHRQQGVAVLSTTLFILLAMAVMTALSARVAVINQRIAANTAYSDSAFQVAEGGLDNALAYLNHNRAYVASTATNGWFNASSSPKWAACSTSDISPPCGDGNANLYGSDWEAYGPVPNLLVPGSTHSNNVYLLSDNINDPPQNSVWLSCLNLALTSVAPAGMLGLISTMNTLLDLLSPGLGLPANMCLPLNFTGADAPPPPSSANPTLRVVSDSSHSTDVRGGQASLQQDLQTTSRFVWDPMAPLMVNGTPHLNDDIRIWGNERPPTRAPYDWSILNLNDIAGLNVTNLIDLELNGGLAASLAPLLNLTVAEVLALDWNATFPLSIWSDETTQLKSGSIPDVLEGGRTCTPRFDNVANSTCLPLSYMVELLAGSVAPGVPATDTGITLKFPDIQDEHNLVSVAAGLLDTSPLIDFPDDLLDHIFGIPITESDTLKDDAVVLSDCSSLQTQPGGMYWVSVDCNISGVVGSSTDPVVLIAEGKVTISAGSEFWGLVFMLGTSARHLDGDFGTPRPTIFGAVVANNTTHLKKDMNIVYDRDVIRRSGYHAGEIVRLPGGWNDALTGP